MKNALSDKKNTWKGIRSTLAMQKKSSEHENIAMKMKENETQKEY